MGINTGNVSFEHPNPNVRRQIFWFYDPTHLLKSCRNHILDDLVILPGNYKISIRDLEDLLAKVRGEYTTAFKFSDDHLDVQGSDRQNATLALQTISEEIAANLKRFFPRSEAKKAMADFFITVARSYKIMCSRQFYCSKDKFKSALRAYYIDQLEVLQQLMHYMENTKFGSNKNKFAKGFIITTKSFVELHALLKDEYDFPLLITSRICQDYVENFFSVTRMMDGGGNRVPSSMETLYRIARNLINAILKDGKIDIFDLKEALEGLLDVPGTKLSISAH